MPDFITEKNRTRITIVPRYGNSDVTFWVKYYIANRTDPQYSVFVHQQLSYIKNPTLILLAALIGFDMLGVRETLHTG